MPTKVGKGSFCKTPFTQTKSSKITELNLPKSLNKEEIIQYIIHIAVQKGLQTDCMSQQKTLNQKLIGQLVFEG